MIRQQSLKQRKKEGIYHKVDITKLGAAFERQFFSNDFHSAVPEQLTMNTGKIQFEKVYSAALTTIQNF